MAAKKAAKKNTDEKKELGVTLIVLMTLLFVSNGVWAFVMYDFNNKKKLTYHYIESINKVRDIEGRLLRYITARHCAGKRDIWKLYAADGILRDSEKMWTLKPYKFYFTPQNCMIYDDNSEIDAAHGYEDDKTDDEDVSASKYPEDKYEGDERDKLDKLLDGIEEPPNLEEILKRQEEASSDKKKKPEKDEEH